MAVGACPGSSSGPSMNTTLITPPGPSKTSWLLPLLPLPLPLVLVPLALVLVPLLPLLPVLPLLPLLPVLLLLPLPLPLPLVLVPLLLLLLSSLRAATAAWCCGSTCPSNSDAPLTTLE